MAVLTLRTPVSLRPTTVATKARLKARNQTSARTAAGTGRPERRGATQPSGARPSATAPAPGPSTRGGWPAAARGGRAPAPAGAEPGGAATSSRPAAGTIRVAASAPAEPPARPVAPAEDSSPGSLHSPPPPANRARRASRVPTPAGASTETPGRTAAGPVAGRPVHPSGTLSLR